MISLSSWHVWRIVSERVLRSQSLARVLQLIHSPLTSMARLDSLASHCVRTELSRQSDKVTEMPTVRHLTLTSASMRCALCVITSFFSSFRNTAAVEKTLCNASEKHKGITAKKGTTKDLSVSAR